jgi:outer membrane protein assembly factor BamE (lipoprotein component of BamABCDE complex)
MMWRRIGLGLLALLWLGGCAGGGLRYGDTLSEGQREADLVARLGQPQVVKPGPDGGKTYIYTTENLDQMAAMGGGAWVKPEQVYYEINQQGIITSVHRYPYGKRSFIFPSKEKPTWIAQAPVAGPKETAPSATSAPAPMPPVTSPEAASKPATAPPPAAAIKPAPSPPPSTKSAEEGASRLELNMSREDVRRILGAPERTEGFRMGKQAVVVWYYLLESRQGRRTLTPLVFEGGRLSGWGDNYYRLRLREISRQQP